MEPAIEIRDLVKTYKGGTQALKGVSLTVPKGGFFALLGPNGAGKTTIIGVITGLVNKTSGTVEVFGVDNAVQPELTRAHLGVVPQNLNLDIFAKIKDILINQAGYYGVPRSVAIPRAEEVLKGLGLYEKKDQTARALSGGMQRRLMIARALMNDPKILILDEPTAGVDVEMRRSMWEYLQKLTEKGVTILLTTHYLEEAEQLAKRVAIINKGEIIEHGTMEEVLAKHQDANPSKPGFRGGKLEEVFLKLTQN